MKKFFLPLLVAMLPCLNSQADPVKVIVDLNAPLCTNFLGFGVQWSAYPWFDISDEAWEKNIERLDFMRVPMVRLMTRSYTFCDGFDAQGNPIYQWDNNRMQKMYRLLDYCQSRHVKVIIGDWDHPSSKEDRPDIASDKLQQYGMTENDPRWHRIICDLLEHLYAKGYSCIVYYNLLNEPNSKSSGCADFPRWKAAAAALNAEFLKRGLAKKIQLAGPDITFLPRDGYWIDQSVLQCPKEIAAYDFHYYAPIADVESGFIEKFCWQKRDYINRYDPQGKSKPFFMGEIGLSGGPVQPQGGSDSQPHIYEHNYGIWMADFNIQCARAGMAGTIAWDLDDAMHINKDKDSKWPDVTKTLFKKWGFWNSLAKEIGHPEDMNLRPWYYTWSLMSRFFQAGSCIVKSIQPETPGLRTLAGTDLDGDFTVALVNDSDKPQRIHLVIPERKTKQKILEYDYFPEAKQVDSKGFPNPQKKLTVEDFHKGLLLDLPGRSFVLLTSVNY